ncbi:MAG: hypothetical protein ACYDHZ_12125 [Dehalococcoidia bacterium]
MKMNRSDAAIVELDTYLCLDLTDKFECRDLANNWRGYYPDYYINNGDKALNDIAVGICDDILAQNGVQKDLSFITGALYFPGERAGFGVSAFRMRCWW